jgi:hypothetical protein
MVIHAAMVMEEAASKDQGIGRSQRLTVRAPTPVCRGA